MPNITSVVTGETCGIEMEFDDLSSNTVFDGIDNSWGRTHDASIETPVLFSQSGISFPAEQDARINKLLYFYSGVKGIEVVSPILDSTDEESFLNSIKKICKAALDNGESLEGERSGIHFHISLPAPSLITLKSIMRLGKAFESLFFNVAGMGYKYRGIENDSIYTRPITSYGPPCIPYENCYAQVYNIKDLLNTKTREEFWNLYGDLRNHGGRYNPVRYSWLNLYPMYPQGQYKGTLEFRVFNKSLNPLYIYSAFMLCKKFLTLALKSTYSTIKELDLLDEHSIYDKSISKDDNVRSLLKLNDLVGLDRLTIETLIKILELTPQIYMEEKYVKTHIRAIEAYYWKGSDYTPKIIKPNQVSKPKYVDIHVLRGENS